jgi:beta-glucanase (GH16 family)
VPALRLALDEPFDSLRIDTGSGHGLWHSYGRNDPANLDFRTPPAEQQVYVDRDFKGGADHALGLQPFAIDHGVLQIRATRTPQELLSYLNNKPYVSGDLTTRRTFEQEYGYFEARLKLPRGKGLLPAFWLLPADESWPPEIDVVESLGDPSMVYATPHTRATGRNSYDTTSIRIEQNPDGFHRFGVLWTPDELTWFIDGVEVKHYPTPSDMHKPMFLIVNLAVGNPWSGHPGPDFKTSTLAVDYIRVWSLATGSAKAGPQPLLHGPCQAVATPTN